jgi:predicted Kef-type K+ transport protein
MSLAQIGEFAFVLLSRASNLHLVEVSGTITVYWEMFSNRELLENRILYLLR